MASFEVVPSYSHGIYKYWLCIFNISIFLSYHYYEPQSIHFRFVTFFSTPWIKFSRIYGFGRGKKQKNGLLNTLITFLESSIVMGKLWRGKKPPFFFSYFFFFLVLTWEWIWESEKCQCMRNFDRLLPESAPTGNGTRILGMCPDQGLSPQTFGERDDVPTNRAT